MDNKCNCGIISGVKCKVENCVYHDPGHKCDAGCIEVGPDSAKTSNDVHCATFKAK